MKSKLITIAVIGICALTACQPTEPQATPTISPVPAVTSSPDATPTQPIATDKSADDVWETLDKVAEAAQQYYEKYSNTVAFASQDGLLYEVPAQREVNVKDLLDITELSAEFADENVKILFIKPSDLKGYKDVKTNEDTELAIFTAYPAKDGFALSSYLTHGGILTWDEYNNLMQKYSSNRGNITRPNVSDSQRKEIEKAISESISPAEAVDIRHLAINDKYAFAVASPVNKSGFIKEYVLLKENNAWVVGLSGFESEPYYKLMITNQYPDFSLALIPKYNMYTHAKFIQSDFTNMLTAIYKADLMPEGTQPSFISGNDEFVYVEYEDKKFLICYDRESDNWQFFTIANNTEGEEIMSGFSKDAPYFIMKQA